MYFRLFFLAILLMLSSMTPATAQHGFVCGGSPLSPVDRHYGKDGWNYDRERVANSYAIYAAASYDAYSPAGPPKETRAFAISDNDLLLASLGRSAGSTGWEKLPRVTDRSGLVYDTYYKNEPNRLVVMVAFRGTDGWIDIDLFSNLSWLLQWINPYDQYREARERFKQVQSDAIAYAGRKPISFITTGHSLGGGLAQHVAAASYCVSTISFNPSFVTNEIIYQKFLPIVRIRVYEDFDIFSRFSSRITNNTSDAVYRMNGIAGRGINAQHSMEGLTAAMARTALACAKRGRNCDMARDQSVEISKILYCNRYRGIRRLAENDTVCVKQGLDFEIFENYNSVRHE